MLTHCGTMSIETDRCYLRQFRFSDDADMLANWISDPNTQSMISEPVYSTKEEVKELLSKYISAYQKDDYYRWVVIEKASQSAIGQVSIFLVDNKNHWGEIEYCIGSRFHRNGYASEATIALINYGFSKVNLHKVQVCHKESNIASKGLILKCGFTFEGTLRDYFYMDDIYVNRCFYSILRSEWEKIHKK